jgi:hypothetical protein
VYCLEIVFNEYNWACHHGTIHIISEQNPQDNENLQEQ